MTEEESKQIDQLYNKFDDLFEEKKFEEADMQIELFLKEDNAARIYIAMLTVCYQWQNNLKNYSQVLSGAKNKLEEKGYTDVQVNATLSGFDKAPDSLLLFKKDGVPYSKKIEDEKGIIVEGNKAFEKLEGLTKEEALLKIHLELTECLLKSVDFENKTKPTYPIEFENEFGRWKMLEDGTTLFQPKTAVEYIELNITIPPSGATFEK